MRVDSFTYKQNAVADLIGMAVKLVENRNVHPIAECIRMRFGGEGEMAVDATNFDQWISVSTPGFLKNGVYETAIVPGKQFHSIISNLPKDTDIKFLLTDKNLKIETRDSKYSFGTLPADTWPQLEQKESSNKIDIDGAEFARVLKFVLPSAPTNDVRAYLNGINLRIRNKELLCFFAGDGHRSTMAPMKITAPIVLRDAGIILPRNLVTFYIDLIEHAAAGTPACLELTEARCRFVMTGDYHVVVTGRLIDGEYPDMDRYIPYMREHGVNTLPRQATMEALRRLEVMSDDAKRFVTLEFADNSVVLSTKGPKGEARETIAISKQLHNMRLSFNSGLLLSLLSAFKYDDISFLIDKTDIGGIAILIEKEEAISREQPQFLSILMPMRV